MTIAAATDALPLFRLTVDKYHAMRDAGILGEDDRVELLEGLLVPKMTKNPPHRLATKLVRSALEAAVPEGYYVDSREPVTTLDSEPEPDVVVVRGQPRDYATRHPGPGDSPLVVEVADESLERDRGAKLRLYARAGVAVYWVLNLRTRSIELCEHPQAGPPPSYARRADFVSGQAVPVTLDGVEVASISVDSLLP